MKITNEHNLDQSIVDYCLKSAYAPKPERMGVTSLIASPKVRLLKLKHFNDIEEDIADRLWALFGTGLHAELAKYRRTGVCHEFKMEVKAGMYTLVGIADIVDFLQKSIDDYKVTSVWSVKFADHDDWEKQLNVYRAMLYMLTGMLMEKLRIHAIMRDWSRREAKNDPSYPQIQFRTIEVKVWPIETAIQYIKDRIELHAAAQESGNLPDCTPEEQWAKPATFAVQKPGAKSAYRVKDTEEEAIAVVTAAKKSAKDKKKKEWADSLQVIERPGQCTKCADFCPVKKWCDQAKKLGYVE